MPLYAGQPISAELKIHTTFRWGLEDDNLRQYVLNYQIEDMTREWLVGGLKQGDFIAKVGRPILSKTAMDSDQFLCLQSDNTYTVPITLMALHHGEFGLPKIRVDAQMSTRSISMGGQSGHAPPSVETYQSHSAVKILVLPRGGRSTFVVAMGSEPDV